MLLDTLINQVIPKLFLIFIGFRFFQALIGMGKQSIWLIGKTGHFYLKLEKRI